MGYVRNARNSQRRNQLAVRPTPPKVAYCLTALYVVAAFFLVRTLPPFLPENIFETTQSRLQAPTDVIFNRLSTLRPNNSLSAHDLTLRSKFINLESRFLYVQYGPEVLSSCPFCSVEDPRSYLYYTVPGILGLHLLNLIVIAAVTSPLLAGREAASWRRAASLAAVATAVADLYFVSTYNHHANGRALRLEAVDFFFWNARVCRNLALAALDGLLGLLLYLSATNRAFVVQLSPADRVLQMGRTLAGSFSRLCVLGVLKNTASRDEELRDMATAYWTHEVNLMRQVMEEREVVELINHALQTRLDMRRVEKDAENYSRIILPARNAPASPPSRAGYWT